MADPLGTESVTVTFAGSGDAFGSGGRLQACVHLAAPGVPDVLIDCGATSLTALKRIGIDPGGVRAVFVSHLHGDHFGGLPFLILDGQFARRTAPLTVVGPPGTAKRLDDTMEALFPGSSSVARRFTTDVVELEPGGTASVGAATASTATVRAWAADHASGAPALTLRLDYGGRTIAYTGDTAWTDDLPAAADRADLLIAEAYYRHKPIPYHLRVADLAAHRTEITARRIIVTHMSDDVLDHPADLPYEAAHDGMTLTV